MSSTLSLKGQALGLLPLQAINVFTIKVFIIRNESLSTRIACFCLSVLRLLIVTY